MEKDVTHRSEFDTHVKERKEMDRSTAITYYDEKIFRSSGRSLLRRTVRRKNMGV